MQKKLSMSLILNKLFSMDPALSFNTFSSPGSLILPLFMHWRNDHFVQAPACNRLITLEISFLQPGEVHLSHLVLRMAGLQQGSSRSLAALIGQEEIDLSWMGTVWAFVPGKMLREHLST